MYLFSLVDVSLGQSALFDIAPDSASLIGVGGELAFDSLLYPNVYIMFIACQLLCLVLQDA